MTETAADPSYPWEFIGQCSLTYLLHVFRRLSPGPIGNDRQPATIGITRAIFEAAMQRHGTFELCDRIGSSKSIDISRVLDGLLLSGYFAAERRALEIGPRQFVLTKFNHTTLNEFYDLELLAYDVWRVGANLRAIAKGARFFVSDDDESFHEERDDELNFLIEHYD